MVCWEGVGRSWQRGLKSQSKSLEGGRVMSCAMARRGGLGSERMVAEEARLLPGHPHWPPCLHPTPSQDPLGHLQGPCCLLNKGPVCSPPLPQGPFRCPLPVLPSFKPCRLLPQPTSPSLGAVLGLPTSVHWPGLFLPPGCPPPSSLPPKTNTDVLPPPPLTSKAE